MLCELLQSMQGWLYANVTVPIVCMCTKIAAVPMCVEHSSSCLVSGNCMSELRHLTGCTHSTAALHSPQNTSTCFGAMLVQVTAYY